MGSNHLFRVLVLTIVALSGESMLVEAGPGQVCPVRNGGFPEATDAMSIHLSTFDTAIVHFQSDDDGGVKRAEPVVIWMQTDLCFGCKIRPITKLHLQTNASPATTAYLDTRFATRIKVTTEDAKYPRENNTYCELRYLFGSFGEYNLSVPAQLAIDGSNITQCGLAILKQPSYAPIAVLVTYGATALLLFCYVAYTHFRKARAKKNTVLINANTATRGFQDEATSDVAPLTMLTVPDVARPVAKPVRLTSVDTFRGLALFHLVAAVTGDGHYFFSSHSRWDGLSVADLFFPWFIFIMGTSINLSFDKLLTKGTSYREIFKKIVIRSITMFIMGVCVQTTNDLRILRIPGVLQRFGITYFVVASSYLLSRRLVGRKQHQDARGTCSRTFQDIVDYLELPLAVCCIAIHLSLTFFLPVPGCPTGYIGPGGPLVGDNGELTNCSGGAAAYIDRMFFTPAHITRQASFRKIYCTTVSQDPEGILGTFTSIALCVFGLQAGKILHLFGTVRGRIIRLVAWGMMLIIAGATLSKCHMSDGWIPINKHLWSVSFVAITGGTAFMLQALLHLLVDITEIWNGAPLIYLGMNSIVLYVGSEILGTFLPFTWAPIVGNHAEFCIMFIWNSCVWTIIAYTAYRKKFFVKI